ncbi:MAG: hypothetical protein FGM54_03630 [Chitinophagaceae bacterium]|nr:hypothetical protein [Chitinophagaceae bacterium]
MMRRILFSSIFLLVAQTLMATDDPQALIRAVNRKLARVNDYTAAVAMQFQLPGVKMDNLSGQVYFKRPDKFRIKAKGLFFMPKQNPMQQVGKLLLDTASYTAVISGYETVQGKRCAMVNVIPLRQDMDLVLGKFWIDVQDPLIYKSQITTKNNGTIESESRYANMSAYALPSDMTIRLEMQKIKMPKMMAADLNKKSSSKPAATGKEKGSITMRFSNYVLNSRFPDQVFTEAVKE